MTFLAKSLLLLLLFATAGCCSLPQLRATHDSNAGTTTVNWQPFEAPERYYNVYRGEEPITNGNLHLTEKVGARLPPGTTTVTFKVNGSGPHYYAISTSSADGQTNTIFARLAGPVTETDRESPRPPVIREQGSVDAPLISWYLPSFNNPERLKCYRVYRNAVLVEQLALTAKVTAPEMFVRAPATPGLYYYTVTAVDDSGNESVASNRLPIVILPRLQLEQWKDRDTSLEKFAF